MQTRRKQNIPHQTGDPLAAQKPTGHTNVRLTMQTYMHVRGDVLRRAAGVLDLIELDGEGGAGTSHRQTTPS